MRLLLALMSLVVTILAQPGYHHESDVHAYQAYHGPVAPLAHDGRVIDTPEVAHAKAAHFHAYHEELSKNSHTHGPAIIESHTPSGNHENPHQPVSTYHYEPEHHKYHGPPAPLAHDGRVIDTPEVAHAKAAHFHAYAEELSKTSHLSHNDGIDLSYHHF